jgi:dihydroneopterin aldolase
MYSIFIRGFRCRAFHGVYPEERVIGQEFEIDATVSFPVPDEVRDLRDSISYADVLAIVRQAMSEPEDLLETVTAKIADRIRSAYGQVVEINITIVKLAAPIPNFGGRVGVTLTKKYDRPS